jgi:dimethylargininase
MMQGLVRAVSRSLADCELLHVPRQTFDLDVARRQHATYVAELRAAGAAVIVLPEEPDLPDATFVEDTVIVLDEVAVLCRLGRASRQLETERIKREIASVRPVHRIVTPGTVEGGDVLRIGRTLYVGLSSRTNEEGIRQLRQIVSPFGYAVTVVNITKCLHLKTGVTSPAEGMLFVNAEWIDARPFQGLEIVKVPAAEPWGANTLAINGTVLVADSSPRTADLLESKGLNVRRLGISELQKAEAGLTCLSVLFSGERTLPGERL